MVEEQTPYTSSFYSNQREGSFRSASVIVPMLLQEFSVSSVVDVGCGVGTWLRVFKEHGVNRIIGIDGDYVDRTQLYIADEEFLSHDLRLPLPQLASFDLAVSLEVAEHLPQQSSKQFVHDLTSLAPIVLFSAALPGQGGTTHINERWYEEWEALFKARGYVCLDFLRPRLWFNTDVEYWYRQNIFVYLREDLLREPVNRYHLSNNSPRMQVVSTQVLDKLRYPGLGAWLRMFPAVVKDFSRRRFGLG